MICILTPYGRTEVTAAAIRLADFAEADGRRVRLVACGQREKNVHAHWDARVRSAKNSGLYKAAMGATAVVHFQSHASWHERTTLTSSKHTKHILVPDWHGLGGRDQGLLLEYDAIVCPSVACAKHIKEDILKDTADAKRVKVARWDLGTPAVARESRISVGGVKAAVYCDAAAIDFCGPMILETVRDVLAEYETAKIFLVSTKSWSRADRATLVKLRKAFPTRLSVLSVRRPIEYAVIFQSVDWVLVPSVRSDFAIAASTAVCSGAGVIANDVPPFSEVVGRSTGILVPCDVAESKSGAPVAIPHAGRWQEACGSAFGDPSALESLLSVRRDFTERHEKFETVWRKLWDA